MIDLPRPPREEPNPESSLHHPAARRRGQRSLRRWTGIGIAGVVGLTAVTAGLAYQVSSSQESAQTAAANQVRSAYRQRIAAEDANLATVRGQARRLARTLAHEHALLVARQRARQQQLAALQAAQVAARAQAAASRPVYVSASPRQVTASRPATVVAAPVRGDDGGATAASGAS